MKAQFRQIARIGVGALAGVSALAFSPCPAHAESPVAPAGMSYVAGGVVKLGPYEADPANWGEHEVYLAPFFVDKSAKPGLAGQICMERKGHLSSQAELEQALRSGAATPAASPERTSTSAIPDDAKKLAATEGMGFYDVLLSGPGKVVLQAPAPEPAADSPARCVISVAAAVEPASRSVRAAVEVRRLRDAKAPVAAGFRAIGDKNVGAPRKLAAGAKVLVIHEEGDWALVQPAKGADDPIGWIPTSALAPSKAKK